MAARRDQLRDTCFSCKSATKKRCGGCFIEMFCSRECQVKEWSTHKIVCHNRKVEYIGFDFTRIWRSPKPSELTEYLDNMRIVKPSKPYFIVKVQLNISPKNMVLHNSDMSVDITVEKKTEFAGMLIDAIKIKGIKGAVGYFAAFVKEEKIFIHPDIQPVETW